MAMTRRGFFARVATAFGAAPLIAKVFPKRKSVTFHFPPIMNRGHDPLALHLACRRIAYTYGVSPTALVARQIEISKTMQDHAQIFYANS